MSIISLIVLRQRSQSIPYNRNKLCSTAYHRKRHQQQLSSTHPVVVQKSKKPFFGFVPSCFSCLGRKRVGTPGTPNATIVGWSTTAQFILSGYNQHRTLHMAVFQQIASVVLYLQRNRSLSWNGLDLCVRFDCRGSSVRYYSKLKQHCIVC
mmetsp:Transcript_11459/g.26569  ORF Transcript_11459/g.26569 Transcript_11459/m.26569 type:complete len:151 (-) Transcript_11459:314-766(-)